MLFKFQILECDEVDAKIKFMTKKGKTYIWPIPDDIAWVSIEDLVCELGEPNLLNNRLQFNVDISKVAGLVKVPVVYK